MNVEFYYSSYDDLGIPPNSVIYCDPYKGRTGYHVRFEHDAFYRWCRDRAEEGHSVFVSEYAMPDDFEEIGSWELRLAINNTVENGVRTDKLFRIAR